MKVHLPEHLFTPEAQRRHPFLLISLFDVCLRRTHQIVMRGAPSEHFDSWKGRLPQEQSEQVENVLRISAQMEARDRLDCEIVVSSEPSNWEISPPHVGPEDLIPLLDEPMSILVEHEINDGAFLKAMGFGDDRKIFLELLEKTRIRFVHGGGSDMRALIVARGREPQRALRSWAIFDSDAMVPGPPSKEAQRKITACETAKIAHHPLHRRAIENYLPADELERAVGKNAEERQRAAAFHRLQPEQRAHFNMKTGFDGDIAQLEPSGTAAAFGTAVQALFATVPTPDRQALSRGFGKQISKLFEAGISEASRRQDGQEEEMVPLFRDILRWL